jgi:hypothetical protein
LGVVTRSTKAKKTKEPDADQGEGLLKLLGAKATG